MFEKFKISAAHLTWCREGGEKSVFFTSLEHIFFVGVIESFGCVHIMFLDEFYVTEHVPGVYFAIYWVPDLISSPERYFRLKNPVILPSWGAGIFSKNY